MGDGGFAASHCFCLPLIPSLPSKVLPNHNDGHDRQHHEHQRRIGEYQNPESPRAGMLEEEEEVEEERRTQTACLRRKSQVSCRVYRQKGIRTSETICV